MSYTLPPLPYGYDALEPYISKQIMELHHMKHHQTYVNSLNSAEAAYAKASSPKERIALQAVLKFNGGGEWRSRIVLSPALTALTRTPFVTRTHQSYALLEEPCSRSSRAQGPRRSPPARPVEGCDHARLREPGKPAEGIQRRDRWHPGQRLGLAR